MFEIFMEEAAGIQHRNADSASGKATDVLTMNLDSCLIHVNYL